MKNPLILHILLIFTGALSPVSAQTLAGLQDSCYYYLKRQDMASFNRIYTDLLEATEKETDPQMYAVGKELDSMRIKDQSIRCLLMDARKRFGENDRRTKRIRSVMEEIDDANAVRVSRILNACGWPGPDDIGEDANEALFLCVQHCNDSLVQNKYLPMLKKAVKQGNAKGWHYAFLSEK